jgi:hypothetical protein
VAAQTGQRLYDASTGLSIRRADRKASPLSELARLLVRFNHVASIIVNADHSSM